MDATQLEQLLRKWGRVFGPAPAAEWDEDDSGGSGGLTQDLLRKLRVGLAAVGAEPVLGETVVRAAGTRDVVRTHFTAKGRESQGGTRVWTPDPEAERVECAALRLYRYNRLQGVVLRFEYCYRGRHSEKAQLVATCLEMPDLKVRRYRQELDIARAWMAGALA